MNKLLERFFPFHMMLGTILFAWVFLLVARGVADPDIWWHMRNAQTLLATGHFPSVDTYSFTVAGTPWINHEWLAEIPYYIAYKAWGMQGLFLVSLVLAESILLGLFFLATKTSGNVKGAFLACCLAVVFCVVSFGPRMLLFGWLFLVLLLIILWRYRTAGHAPVWVIPPVFCLWINCHGSWLIGLIVFFTIVVAGMVKWEWHGIDAIDDFRWTPQQMRTLSMIAIASIAALFVNPFGYFLVKYPFDVALMQKLNVAHVEEWMSVNFHDARGKFALAMLLVLLLYAIVSKHKWRLHEVLLAFFALYTSLTYIRFLFLAAILLTPLLSRGLDFLPPYRKEIDKYWLNAIIVLGLVIYMWTKIPSNSYLQSDFEKDYPVAAVKYMQSHQIRDRVFAYYSWGGYLIWQDPPIPTFVDSRTDIFEYHGEFKDYLDTVGIVSPIEVLDRHKVQYVLFPEKDPLCYLLRQNKDWELEYSDNLAVLFRRAKPQPGS